MNQTWIALSEESQPLADAAIDALGQHDQLPEHPALLALTEWLDEDGRMVECVCDQSTWVHAPELSQLISSAFDSFEGPDTHEAILQHLNRTITDALGGDEAFWGIEYCVPIIAYLQHSDGRSALVCFEIVDYGHGPYRWHGLFRDSASVEAWMRARGRILSMEDYAAIPRETLLSKWGKHY